ncbi:MAG: ABC transporter permease, partial [Variovorax paradoxus]|nr:ABC transporter permease [Variovorax paradoxus]
MKRTLIASACLAATCLMAVGAAQAQDKVKIGFITDMSSLYADV